MRKVKTTTVLCGKHERCHVTPDHTTKSVNVLFGNRFIGVRAHPTSGQARRLAKVLLRAAEEVE